jgi:hypothetical protein
MAQQYNVIQYLIHLNDQIIMFVKNDLFVRI